MSRRKKKTFNYFLAKAALKHKHKLKSFFLPKSRLARIDFLLRGSKFRIAIRHYISPSYLDFPVSTKAIREEKILYKYDSENKIYYGYSFNYFLENYGFNKSDEKWCELVELLREQVKFPDELHFNKEIEYKTFKDCPVLYLERDASKFYNI